MKRHTCDVCPKSADSKRRFYPSEAVYDLRRYRLVVGIPGQVRYFCEDCARGRIAPKYRDKLRIAMATE